METRSKTGRRRPLFYVVEEVQKVLDGSKAYVIGRKGTGKTAIAEHLLRSQNFDTFTEKLTFKNFPFNELYALKNDSYNSPNQYITVWKYLIYSCVCKMMVRNESIDPRIREQLAKIYVSDPTTSLSRTISRWTSREFGLNILGSGLTIKLGTQPTKTEIPLSERVEILEDIVLQYVDSSKYFVIFDELDEDYKDILSKARNEEYFHLLTSLFKAAQDVRSTFSTAPRRIYPVIFLRDDIYDFIRDADKNKWKDFHIALEWNVPKIQDLLAFRISRAIAPHQDALPFHRAWGLLMAGDGGVNIGNQQRNEMSKFDYIARSTYLRPRDFIRFMQVAAESEIADHGFKIRSSTLKHVDKAF